MKYLPAILMLLLLNHCGQPAKPQEKSKDIKHSSPLIHYNGRINITDTAAIIYWPGSSVNFSFVGAKLTAIIADQNGQNFFDIIVDSQKVSSIKLKKGKHEYILASSLKYGHHTVSLFKRNEYMQGKTFFYSAHTDSNGYFTNFPDPKLTIEFYGNSITAGLANLDPKGKKFSPEYQDNYLSYAARTARALHADYYCIARSGIGLTVSWMPVIMPELFYRLDPEDSLSFWDFRKVQPDIVVVNLFQNDYWITQRPEHPQYKRRFGNAKPEATYFINAYYQFIDTLLRLYPHSRIICTLGPMSAVKEGSPWPGYIKAAVNKLNNPRVYTFFYPYFVKQRHPTAADHEKMAKMLVNFITNNVQLPDK